MDRGQITCASKATAISCLVSLGLGMASTTLDAAIDTVGTEYSVLGPQIGDQFFPKLSVNSGGGYLVWQDNNIDEDGLGVRAVRLDRNMNAVMGAFRVNESSEGDQQRPVVAQLNSGGAAFAWESGSDVFIRFVGSDGVFLGAEQTVNSYIKSDQRDPAMATLDNGNIVVVWSSLDQDGDMQGVYGQLFDEKGKKISAEFFVNQSVFFNQRTPSVAALEEGDFVVAWISEQYAGTSDRIDQNGQVNDSGAGGERYEVSMMGRVFNENGLAVSDEILLGDARNLNANPALAAVEGGFMAFYTGRENVEKVSNMADTEGGWDIFGQRFTELGESVGQPFTVNETLYGDQIVPAVARVGDSVLVAWTSLGQDGDREGVFARLVSSSDLQQAAEFQVNSISANKQLLPAVGADGEGNALIVWGGFTGGRDSFDLQAQKFATDQPLPVLEAPFVFGSGYWSLGVSWPSLDGVEIESYELYLDGSELPVITSGNMHTFSGLNAGSEHSIELSYVLPDGSRSPKSKSTFGRTWGRDQNFDLLPDDWQESFFGIASVEWPGAAEDSDGDGASNVEELLAGTDPTDAASLLETQVVNTATGLHLQWNTSAGGVYQVQVSTDISSWFDTGAPRLAVGGFDSISIVNDQGIAVYRVLKLR